MRVFRGALALAAASAAVLVGSIVLAGDPRVLLVGPSATHPTVARVRQELEILGLEVQVVVGPSGADLGALARERGAAAVARVEDWPPEIVVWVDSAHGATADASDGHEIRVSESLSGPVESGLLALRAIELLRGRLIPVPTRVPPDAGTEADDAPAPAVQAVEAGPPAPPAAAPQRADSLPRARRRLEAPSSADSPGSLFVGPALAFSPGGVPAVPHVRVGGSWETIRRVALEGLVLIPTIAATVTAPEGEIDLRLFAFGAGASATVTDPSSPLAIRAGAGLGALLLLYEGRAAAPWSPDGGSRWTSLPYASAGVGYRLSPAIAVRADVVVALARPEPVLVIADRAVASFGQPALFGSLALEARP